MPDEVEVTIGGTRFTAWEALTLQRSIDSAADAFSITAPFDPARQDVWKAFRPFSYPEATVAIDGEVLIRGTVESVGPSLSGGERQITVQGRSRTGVLIDCAIDGAGYQFAGMTIGEIAARLCEPFGIEVVAGEAGSSVWSRAGAAAEEYGKPIEESRAQPGTSVFSFLQRLCDDLGVLASCDAQGRLVIAKPASGQAPIAALQEGRGGLLAVSADYDGTRRYSRYRVLQQQDGLEAIEGLATDPAIGAYRPTVLAGADGEARSVQAAAEWARAQALAASVGAQATVSGWRAPGGEVWRPGRIVTLLAPSVYIGRESAYMIAGATLKLDAQGGRTSELRLVLPATYTGQMPGGYPWD